jgi:hypothetical protein
VKKRSGFYPRVGVDAAGSQVVSQAGGVVLVETVRAVGLDRALSAGLAPCVRVRPDVPRRVRPDVPRSGAGTGPSTGYPAAAR